MGHVIITGGSSGIGKALAKLYLEDGHNVSLLARRLDVLEEAKKELSVNLQHDQIIAINVVDVSDELSMKKVIAALIDEMGNCDVFIASAGFSKPGYFEKQNAEIHKKTFDINYFGALYGVQAVVPKMINQKSGRIILISSAAGLIGVFGHTAYSASKFALNGFGESLRAEMKPLGITVSVAYPPDTDTPMMNNHTDKPYETKVISSTAGLYSADAVAKSIKKGNERGDFALTTGVVVKLLNRFGSLLMPVLNWKFDKAILKARKQRGL